jgi:hypothetical protein
MIYQEGHATNPAKEHNTMVEQRTAIASVTSDVPVRTLSEAYRYFAYGFSVRPSSTGPTVFNFCTSDT